MKKLLLLTLTLLSFTGQAEASQIGNLFSNKYNKTDKRIERFVVDGSGNIYLQAVSNNIWNTYTDTLFTRVVARPTSMTLQALIRNPQASGFIWADIATQQGSGLEQRGEPGMTPQALINGQWCNVTNGIVRN